MYHTSIQNKNAVTLRGWKLNIFTKKVLKILKVLSDINSENGISRR